MISAPTSPEGGAVVDGGRGKPRPYEHVGSAYKIVRVDDIRPYIV